MISGEAIAQPILHPVTEYVFEIEFIVTVLSFIPGNEAIDTPFDLLRPLIPVHRTSRDID